MYGVHRHDPTFFPYFKYTAHGEKCIHKKMWDGYAVRRHDPTFSYTLNTQPMEEDLYIKKTKGGWVCMMFTGITQLFPHTLSTKYIVAYELN